MKKIIFSLAVLILFFGVHTSVSALDCPTGQIVQSVEIASSTPEVPAVTHIVSHPAVTHDVDHPAITHTETTCDADNNCTDTVIIDTPAWTETVIDTPAYDETVTDVPEIPAVPAVYEDQCIVDPNYVAPVPTPAPVVISGNGPIVGSLGTVNAPVVVSVPEISTTVTTDGQGTIQEQLVSALQQLVVLYEQLLALQHA